MTKLSNVPEICHLIFKNLFFADFQRYGKLRDAKNFCNAVNIAIAPECAVMLEQIIQYYERFRDLRLIARAEWISSKNSFEEVLPIRGLGYHWRPDEREIEFYRLMELIDPDYSKGYFRLCKLYYKHEKNQKEERRLCDKERRIIQTIYYGKIHKDNMNKGFRLQTGRQETVVEYSGGRLYLA